MMEMADPVDFFVSLNLPKNVTFKNNLEFCPLLSKLQSSALYKMTGKLS